MATNTVENAQMSAIEQYLLNLDSKTYASYYNGKMSLALAGKSWKADVLKAFPDVESSQTSENIFKDVIDLYVSSVMPTPEELKGFKDTLVPLLIRGQAPVVRTAQGDTSFPEHYEMISDGNFTVAAIFTRSLKEMKDYITFISGSGEEGDATARLFSKDAPSDLSKATHDGFRYVEETHGHTLYRLNLDDRGMGGALSALQDRTNHSILDQTAVAEMYARPFWYLLNTDLPVKNPYMPPGMQPSGDALKEHKTDGAAGRVFTTSSEGPFGQLDPPTLTDMISYHDSIIGKVSQSTGIPEFYFKPGGGQTPSGVALKVLSRRFNNKIGRIRDNIKDDLLALATQMNVKLEEGQDEISLWDATDDLLQDALDAHGEALFRMGYPLEYIAEVVTPGVDLDDYMDDGFDESQVGPTPDQVAAYAANPGQQAGQPVPPVPAEV